MLEKDIGRLMEDMQNNQCESLQHGHPQYPFIKQNEKKKVYIEKGCPFVCCPVFPV
jgi:hypothetical protein